MDAVTTHTMVIHRNKVKKMRGGVGQIYKQIALEEEVYENTRVNEEKKRAKTEIFIREFRSGARSAGLVQSRIKSLAKQERKEALTQIKGINFNFKSIAFKAEKMMMINNLGFNYEGHPNLIEKLNFEIKPQDRIGIIGQNGKGKSTLLKLLSGKLAPTQGNIKKNANLKSGYFGQTNEALFDPNRNIVEEIQYHNSSIPEQEIRNICGSLLFSGDTAYKKLGVLSGGEKSRVNLGKILVQPFHLLLLDEPTNHLDLESSEELAMGLKEFDGACVFISHNEYFLRQLATSLVVFDEGGIYFFKGGYNQFLSEIGWSDEAGEAKVCLKSSKDERIEQRKKQKQLKPLKNKIEKIEKELKTMEKEVEIVTKALETAHKQGAVLKINDIAVALQALEIAKAKKEEEWMEDLEEYEILEKQ